MPDLAFAEMDFLQRSKQRLADTEEEKHLSKSQEKERRRTQRVHNEISDYFRPSTGADRKNGATLELSRGKPLDGRRHISYSISTSPTPNHNGVPFEGFGHQQPFTQELFTAQRPLHRVPLSEVPPNRTGKLSDKSTTYYTWSESARSPGTVREKEESTPRVSTTPESIRRSLEMTGVFSYTGMKGNSRRKYNHSTVQSGKHENQVRELPQHKIRSPSVHRNRRLSDITEQDQELEEPSSFHDNDTLSRGNIKPHMEHTDGHLPAPEISREENLPHPKPIHVLVERYEPGIGWQREIATSPARDHSPTTPDTGGLERAKFRHMVAQAAYVKPPPTAKAGIATADSAEPDISPVVVPNAHLNTNQPLESTDHQQVAETIGDNSGHSESNSCKPVDKADGDQVGDEAETGNENGGSTDENSNESRPSEASAPISNLKDQPDTQSAPTKPPSRALPTRDASVIRSVRHSSGQSGATDWPRVEARGSNAEPEHVFRGLPVRGSTFGQINNHNYTRRVQTPSVVVEPLYSHQLDIEPSGEFEHFNDDPGHFSDDNFLPDDNELLYHMENQEDSFPQISNDELSNTDEIYAADDAYINNVNQRYYQLEEQEHYDEWEPSHYAPSDQVEVMEDVPEESEVFNPYAIPRDEGRTTSVCGNHFGYTRQIAPPNFDQHMDENSLARFWRPQRRY